MVFLEAHILYLAVGGERGGRSQDGSATGFGNIIITVPPRVCDVMMFENLARHGGGLCLIAGSGRPWVHKTFRYR